MQNIPTNNLVILDYVSKYNGLIDQHGITMAGADSFKVPKDLLDKAGYEAGMSILDYGCGWGSLLEVVNDYEDYHGVDTSPLMISEAKKMYPGKLFSISEMGNTTVGEKDIVVAHSVFTHIPKSIVGVALSDIKNNLKSEGFALIDVFLKDTGNPDFEYYSQEEWLDILKANGLTGEFLDQRLRHEPYMHNYYKVVRSNP